MKSYFPFISENPTTKNLISVGRNDLISCVDPRESPHSATHTHTLQSRYHCIRGRLAEKNPPTVLQAPVINCIENTELFVNSHFSTQKLKQKVDISPMSLKSSNSSSTSPKSSLRISRPSRISMAKYPNRHVIKYGSLHVNNDVVTCDMGRRQEKSVKRKANS